MVNLHFNMKFLFVTPLFFLIVIGLNAQVELTQESLLKFRHDAITSHYDSLEKIRQNCLDSLKMKNTIAANARLYNELKSLTHLLQWNSSRGFEDEAVDFEFIRNNPSSPTSLHLLFPRINNKQCVNGYDSFYHYFSILSESLKKSNNGKTVEQQLSYWKNSAVGNEAPDFKVKTINNKTLTLREYLNKNVVLLDFWGSRCGPCRHGMPFLKQLYSKYHNNGFEIIGIAAKYDENDNILLATKQDGTDIWKQVAQKQNMDDVFNKYFVQPIPVRILISKEGVIIGRWYGENEENNASITNKFSEIFK